MDIGTSGIVGPPASSVLTGAQKQEAAGFASTWWPDHLMAWHPQAIWTTEFTPLAHRQPNPNVFLDTVACMTAAAVVTEHIRIGSSVTDPVRRHPAVLAQEFLSIHHFADGRSIFGIGTGEGENAIPYGLSIDRPASRLEEALEIIRLLWSSDGPVDYDSQFWPHEDAVFGMGPVADAERGLPPIWVAAHGPRMLDITGRLADGWLPTYLPTQEYGRRLKRIHDARVAAGREDGFEAGLWAYTVIGESKEDCLKLFESPMYKSIALQLPAAAYEQAGYEPPLGPDTYGFNDFIPSRFNRDGILKVLDRVPIEMVRRAILHGSPDDLVEELREFEKQGCGHAVLWNISFLTDVERVRSSFQSLVEIQQALRP